jgi:hypothetical protein
MKHIDLINKKYTLLKKHLTKHTKLEDITTLIICFLVDKIQFDQFTELLVTTSNFIDTINNQWVWLDVKLCKCCENTIIILENIKEINAIRKVIL